MYLRILPLGRRRTAKGLRGVWQGTTGVPCTLSFGIRRGGGEHAVREKHPRLMLGGGVKAALMNSILLLRLGAIGGEEWGKNKKNDFKESSYINHKIGREGMGSMKVSLRLTSTKKWNSGETYSRA